MMITFLKLKPLIIIGGAFAASACCTLLSAAYIQAFGQGNQLFGVQIFPSNSIFNTPINTLPVSSKSTTYINSIGASTALHADVGTVYNGAQIGIPYNQATASTPQATLSFSYADESDPAPYYFSRNMNIEGSPAAGQPGSGDAHLLAVNTANAAAPILEETFAFGWGTGQKASAGSGAKWKLSSNTMRPSGWTSADAAGLPITPLLLKYAETYTAAHGGTPIRHALRFTASKTRNTYLWPASHYASSRTSTQLPPMGIRVRLKSAFNLSGFSAMNQAIGRAMQTYGMILADNGSNWYVSGAPDPNWNDSDLRKLFSAIHGSDFEVVDESSMNKTMNSYKAN